VLLKERAAALSKRTEKVHKSKIEVDRGRQSLGQSFKIALSRPWILLIREPIVTLYMMFAAFPIVYQQELGWSEGIGGLAFLGVAVGMMAVVIYTIPDNNRHLRAEAKAKAKAKGEIGAAPEARLPPALVGSIFLPIDCSSSPGRTIPAFTSSSASSSQHRSASAWC
jgi:hypothetical protein